MEKTVRFNYEVNENEFDGLRSKLEGLGYHFHGFFGMDKYVINNGKQKISVEYKEFADLNFPKEKNSWARIETENSELASLIDSHFQSQEIACKQKTL
jgi:hypothetical protein